MTPVAVTPPGLEGERAMVIFRAAVLLLGLSLAAVAHGESANDHANRGGRHRGPDRSSRLVPANGATGAYVDTRLTITFDSVPTLGTSGTIKVFNAGDNTLVDTIDISGAPASATGETQTVIPKTNTEIDQIGAAVTTLGGRSRWVYYTPVEIDGRVASIKLHDGKLAYDTSYYVTLDDGVLTGTVRGAPFTGITTADGWSFTTKSPPQSYLHVVVDDDGRADFRSVQGALNWIMNHCASDASASFGCNTVDTPKTIDIRSGTYNELLFIRNLANITLRGSGRHSVVIQQENFESYNPGTGGSAIAAGGTNVNEGGGTRRALGGGRAVLLVEGADLLKLSGFTLRNSHIKDVLFNNQAETIYFNSAVPGASRLVASHMNFLSTQDTIQLKGWAWIYRSLISGDVDFIWGAPFAVLIEQSRVNTVVDTSAPMSGGYVVQSRAYFGYPGFIFLDSVLTADKNVPTGTTYLARSGGAGTNGFCSQMYLSGSASNINLFCDNVAYIDTKMGPHVRAVGWLNTPAPNLSPTATTGWRESGSMDLRGRALDVTARDPTVSSTSADLSGLDTRTKVFAGWNHGEGWVPEAVPDADSDHGHDYR
jgi:pectin methylesterase-like acyl-CoA thioesterase